MPAEEPPDRHIALEGRALGESRIPRNGAHMGDEVRRDQLGLMLIEHRLEQLPELSVGEEREAIDEIGQHQQHGRRADIERPITASAEARTKYSSGALTRAPRAPMTSARTV